MVSGWNSRNLVSGNVKAADVLKQFRKVYYDKSRLDTIEELARRINLKQSQFSASGRENAIRNEFRQLALNPRRMRLFPKNEQKMIERVAKGGPIRNVLRYFGKFAPTGAVSGLFHLGAAGGGVASGIDPVTASLLAGGTAAARLGAGRMARGQIDNLINQITEGGPVVRPRSYGTGAFRGLLSAPTDYPLDAGPGL